MGIIDLGQLREQSRRVEPVPGLDEAHINGALDLMGQVDDPEVASVAAFLRDNVEVVKLFSDRSGRLRIPEASKLVRVAFVDDETPGARQDRNLRELPRFVESVGGILLPREVSSHPVIAAAVLGHEGVHVMNFMDPDFAAKAHELFPNTSADEAKQLVTEVKAFELEGKILDSLFGESYREYIQSEVDAADDNAVANQESNNGLLMETGIDSEVIERAVQETVSFTTEDAKNFCLSALAVAVPTYAACRVIDQIFDRNELSDSEKTVAKATIVGQFGYLY